MDRGSDPKQYDEADLAAKLRSLAMDLLRQRHGPEVDSWPVPARLEYEAFQAQQEQYERQSPGRQPGPSTELDGVMG